MEKCINNNKILIVSHINDTDGLGCVILAKLAFGEVDYLLIEIKEQPEMLNFIKTVNYEQIYICDIGMQDTIGDEINKLDKNILHFDHHQTSIEVSKYTFSTVEVMLNNRKTCATELFYDYLVKNNLLNGVNSVSTFVELTRSVDTWDWQKDNNQLANDLGILTKAMEPQEFINAFSKALKKLKEFKLSQEQINIINYRKKDIADYSNECMEAMLVVELENLKGGLVFADRFASHIGNDICLNKEVDLSILVDMLSNSVSLRSVGDLDISVIAKKFGGGGHKNAAGFPLTKENKIYFLNLIINTLNK